MNTSEKLNLRADFHPTCHKSVLFENILYDF